MRANLNFFRFTLLICLGMTCFTGLAAPAATNNAAESAAGTNAEDLLRSYLQIQEQLHNLQQADEKSREEADAAALRNTQLLNQRLDQIETSLASQHWDELKDMQRANEETQHFSRLVLIASGTFAGFAFLVLLFAAFLQWTVVNRVSAMAAKLAPELNFGPGQAALGAGEGGAKLLGGPAGEQTTSRLLGAIASLEKRIQEMEAAVQSPHSPPEGELANGGTNGETNGAAHQLTAEAGPATVPGKSSGMITLLLGKGQTLLRLDKIDMAIVCFDEVLAIDPQNTDALVKKGAALERLQRLDEAIECFDRAIAVDNSMTMAYLHKGGVFNRMERYAEALECYEKALRTQEKSRSANVITE